MIFTEADKQKAVSDLTAGKPVPVVASEYELPEHLVKEWNDEIPKEKKEEYSLLNEIKGDVINPEESVLTEKEKKVLDKTVDGLGFIARKIANMDDEALSDPSKAASINKHANSLAQIYNAIKNKGGANSINIDTSTKTVVLDPSKFRA